MLTYNKERLYMKGELCFIQETTKKNRHSLLFETLETGFPGHTNGEQDIRVCIKK
jgi:hypothetical protein